MTTVQRHQWGWMQHLQTLQKIGWRGCSVLEWGLPNGHALTFQTSGKSAESSPRALLTAWEQALSCLQEGRLQVSSGVSEMWVKGKKKPEILTWKPGDKVGLGQTQPGRQGEPRWTLVHREGCGRATSGIHSAPAQTDTVLPLRQMQCSCSDRCWQLRITALSAHRSGSCGCGWVPEGW